MWTLFIGTVCIDIERMIANAESVFDRYFFLPRFYGRIVKFLQMAALHAHDVVMVLALIEFEDRLPAFKAVSHQ